jgi:hypothetical protein
MLFIVDPHCEREILSSQLLGEAQTELVIKPILNEQRR